MSSLNTINRQGVVSCENTREGHTGLHKSKFSLYKHESVRNGDPE